MRTLAFLSLLLPVVVLAQQPNPNEARLREALRDATAKLQAAQNEVANLQATNTGLLAERDQAVERAATFVKQLNTESSTNEKALKELRAKATAQAEELEKTRAALKELQSKHDSLVDSAARLESDKAELQIRISTLEGRVTDRENKNVRLYLLANEILKRYEDHSFGRALLAKEPFIGRAKTNLENLVQEYRDKIDSAIVKS